MKKVIITIVSFIFAMMSSSAVAGKAEKGTSKKWDPAGKPTALYNKQGQQVNMKNINAFKGKTLYDKDGNAFSIQHNKIIRLSSEKKLDKRINPAPLL